jgi:GDP-mannose transporter
MLVAYRYTGWLCRGMVSATSFTLVGVVNKFLTVLLNVIVWDKHSTPSGIAAVCLCLLAGVFYQQAPRRDDVKSEERVVSVKHGKAEDDGKAGVELTDVDNDADAAPLLGEKGSQ